MTNHDKFQLCMEAAKKIVAAYRAEAPEGIDPQNSWVALAVAGIGAAASVGTSMYSQSQAKKAAANGAPQLAQMPVQNMPGYLPLNFNTLNSGAIINDKAAYRRSDKDFARRHPGLAGAEVAFEQSVLKDQTGDTALMPALQNEFVTAGIGSTLDAFGDRNTLAPGSAGEANVAKNLGLSIAALQDRNRANRMQSLTTAEGLFPRREIGMSGKDFSLVEMLNTEGQNAFNQANFAATVGQQQYNQRIDASNQATAINQANAEAAAKAAQQAELMKALSGLASSAVSGVSRSSGANTNRIGERQYATGTVPRAIRV